VFVEAMLSDGETADETLPILFEIAPPEVRSPFLDDDDKFDLPVAVADGEVLPLQLVLNPPRIFGQVEALTPEELAEFHKEFSSYDAETQLANCDPIRNTLTPSQCTQTCSYVTCGVDIPVYDAPVDDRLQGE